MVDIVGIGHFSIPVSDMERSVKFYSEVVGCKLIRTDKNHAFMDAGGVCILLCRQKAPINQADQLDFVHHSFAIPAEQFKTVEQHLKKHNVEMLYSEVRDGGTVNGPRTYFRDPDGTRLEFIDLTSYDPTPGKSSKILERHAH
jgi:catechol 2,3-dioxygenase-like lactoylglutathione lyase family enzyme